MKVKKEEKKKITYEKVVSILFIIVSVINLIINYIIFPQYCYNRVYEATEFYNSLLSSSLFGILLWSGSILVYIFGIWYLILVIKAKKQVLVKSSLIILSVCYAPVTINLIMNFLAKFFFIGF